MEGVLLLLGQEYCRLLNSLFSPRDHPFRVSEAHRVYFALGAKATSHIDVSIKCAVCWQ